MAQIKSYVDLESFDEITTFVGATADRIVRTYTVTDDSARFVGEIFSSLAAPRGSTPALQFICGRRGSGKSHLLALIRSLINHRPLRNQVYHPHLQTVIGQLGNKSHTAIDLSFPAGEQLPFEEALRLAINSVLVESAAFDNIRWKQAIERDQVFEQTLSLLPPDAQLIVLIDNLPTRWRLAPELVEADLKWLGNLVSQAAQQPLRLIVALEETTYEFRLAEREPFNQSAVATVRHLSPRLIREAIASRVLKKKSGVSHKLSELYQQIKQHLPHFTWSEAEFIDYYPAHPVVETLAPALCVYSRNFSLPGFVSAAASRALNRPELSLVAVDELFDRYEYELRKSEQTATVFAFFDRINSEGLNGLTGEDRLWAKMLGKALTLFLLTEEPVEVCTLADSILLFEGSQNGESGYERAARILAHFETIAPERICLEGQGHARSWLLPAKPAPIPLRERVATVAAEISSRDPRLASLLVRLGAGVFSDWNDLFPAHNPGLLPESENHFALPADLAFREVLWRGTARLGTIFLDPDEAGTIQNAGPFRADLLEPGDPAAGIENGRMSEEDWRLLVVPFTCDFRVEAPVNSLAGLRWHPGVLSDETSLEPLKMLLALRELQSQTDPAQSDEESQISPEEASRLEKELYQDIRALFTQLYLERGSFADHNGPRPLSLNGHQETRFTDFLHQEIRTTLNSYYPDHPYFEERLTGDEVIGLLSGMFAISSTADEQTRKLAARFAVPLGLVSEARGKYRLNVFNEAANLPPFIHALVTLVELHANEEGSSSIPLQKVTRLLNASPYGLQAAAQHLILVAFISSGVYELADEATGKRLTKSNLHLGFDPERFTTLRRVATTDYPVDILHTWLKCLTGRDELPAMDSSDARKNVREVLVEWLEYWREQNLRQRFEEVPADLMTMMTWHTVQLSIRRQERTATIVESIIDDSISLETGLSRILDLYGLDIAALEQTSVKMHSLSEFLAWLPLFINIKNYLLATETTGETRIDRESENLNQRLREPHELLMPAARQHIEQAFDEYRELYSHYYAEAHENHVGLRAYQELLETFFASDEWQTFKLLNQLKFDGRAFESDARMLNELVEKTRCDLPINDILQRQPHCGCSFRLNRRLHLGSVVDAFKTLARSAVSYYSEKIREHRETLRQRLSERTPDAFGAVVSDFINACGEGRVEGLSQEVVALINEFLPDPPMVAIVPEMPRFEDGSFTKDEMRDNISRWLETLPEEDGLRFRVERA